MEHPTSPGGKLDGAGTGCRRPAVFCLLLAACCLPAGGCGGQKGLPTQVVHGTVTISGETPDSGRVRFVPIEGTKGPASMGQIVDGQYRIDARGGVPVGKHRVEVTALKKTGRKVAGSGPSGEPMQVDETVSLSPTEYAGTGSPLVFEVVAGSDGRIDIEIPHPAGVGR